MNHEQGQRPERDPAGRAGARRAGLILLLILVATTALRWRLIDTPLERDEGEYALAGQLMLQGVPPYRLVWNMKFPGTYGAYAASMALFGQTPRGIHLGLLAAHLASVALMFALARRLLTDDSAALVSAGALALLPLGEGVLGFAAHATQFIAPLAVGGWLVLEYALGSGRRRWLAAAGVLLGLAILVKQHAAAFALFAALRVVAHEWTALHCRGASLLASPAALAAGIALPLAAVVGALWQAGVLGDFWFWTIVYAGQYATSVPLAQAPRLLVEGLGAVLADAPLVWLVALVGLFALASPPLRPVRWRIAGWVACSAFAVVPGFYFRQHYFIVVLPAAALLVGAGVHGLRKLLPSRLCAWPSRVAGAALVASVAMQSPYLFRLDPQRIVRDTYWPSVFADSQQIATFIQSRTRPQDTVAVLGSEPQIPFYARRRPATPFLYVYPLMEDHPYAADMQREMIEWIERERPAAIVVVNVGSSWLRRPTSPDLIFQWMDHYLPAHYEPAALFDLHREGTQMRPGAAAPTSENHVTVYLRREADVSAGP